MGIINRTHCIVKKCFHGVFCNIITFLVDQIKPFTFIILDSANKIMLFYWHVNPKMRVFIVRKEVVQRGNQNERKSGKK